MPDERLPKKVILMEHFGKGGALGWLERRTPDRETRVRSSAGSVCCLLEQETFTPQKVLVIPRNRWLRLNMTEKLFTGTLNHNQNKKKKNFGKENALNVTRRHKASLKDSNIPNEFWKGLHRINFSNMYSFQRSSSYAFFIMC